MREEAVASTIGGPRLAERVRRTARLVAREAAAAFERTPLEVLLGACAAVGLSVAVETDTMETWGRLLVAVGIALPLTFAASALHARGAIRPAVRWLVSGLAVLAGALYGFYRFDPERIAEGWRAALLVGAAVAALACVPLIRAGAGDVRESVHRFIARLAARGAIVLAYAAALWVGLALALAAVNGLFELHLPGKAWTHLTAAVFVLLPPWAVAAGLPELVAPIDAWYEDELRLFRRVGAFLLVPLVLIYLAIVYAYTVRVLATGEVPKNLVSPVVIGAGLLIVATTVALEPVHADARAAGLSLLVRLASPLLLPLVLFAIWAVSTRVDQYGWTEFRYLRLLTLVLLGVWGAAAAWRFARRRRPPLTAAPAVLAAVLLLAAVGPWSATAVARRSQAAALRELLAAAGKTRREPPAPIPSGVFRGITDKAAYLGEHFGWATVRGVVPWIGGLPGERLRPDLLAERIGIVERPAPGLTRIVEARLPDDRGIPGIEGGTLYLFDTGGAPSGYPDRVPAGRGGGGSAAAPAGPAPGGAGISLVAAAAGAPGDSGGVAVRLDREPGRLLALAPGGDTLAVDLVPLLRALLDRTSAIAGRPVRRGRAGPGGEPPPEVGRAITVQLAPGEALQPLLRADGVAVGQIVLRRLGFEADSAAVAGTRAPRITSAGGFVLLRPAIAAGRR